MKRITPVWIVLTAALLVPTAAFAQIACTRDGLQNAVDLYIAAQTSGDRSGLPLPPGVGYMENVAIADIETGLINTPMVIDHHRSLFDTDTCPTFTEVIVTDEDAPYVLGTRLRVNGDKIAEIEILWTTTGYWLFDADAYLQYSSTEDWGPIPVADRDSRGTLVAVANAYLDAFLEGNTDIVPWGYPYVRTEGGTYTGTGSDDDTCAVGVPSGVNSANRRFVVDETIGSVVVFCTFGAGTPGGGSGAPATHLLPGGERRPALRPHVDAPADVGLRGRGGQLASSKKAPRRCEKFGTDQWAPSHWSGFQHWARSPNVSAPGLAEDPCNLIEFRWLSRRIGRITNGNEYRHSCTCTGEQYPVSVDSMLTGLRLLDIAPSWGANLAWDPLIATPNQVVPPADTGVINFEPLANKFRKRHLEGIRRAEVTCRPQEPVDDLL